MLGCKFSFKTYAKNVRERATKCSLKTTEVLLDADGYQGAVALDCFRATQTLDVLFLFQKKILMFGVKFTLSDVTSFLPDDLSGLKKIIFTVHTNYNNGSEIVSNIFRLQE